MYIYGNYTFCVNSIEKSNNYTLYMYTVGFGHVHAYVHFHKCTRVPLTTFVYSMCVHVLNYIYITCVCVYMYMYVSGECDCVYMCVYICMVL